MNMKSVTAPSHSDLLCVCLRSYLLGSFQIRNLEETVRNTEAEYSHRLAPLNKVIMDLAAELEKVRSQVEQQVETNKNLLCVKMKLESEINSYQQLIHGMTTDTDR